MVYRHLNNPTTEAETLTTSNVTEGEPVFTRSMLSDQARARRRVVPASQRGAAVAQARVMWPT
jgi:hypothetical protein